LDNRKITYFAIIVLLAVLLLFFSAARSVNAETSTSGTNEIMLTVNPSVVLNYSEVQGQSFTVKINALKAESLHGFMMRLTYDGGLIECTSVQEGDLLPGYGNTTVIYDIDNGLMRAALGTIYASSNLTSPGAMASGNGTLFMLTFNVKGVGETKIGFENVSLYDPAGSSLPFAAFDGYFNNKLNIDFTMPFVLFAVTVVSMFLNGKVEDKLKSVLEEREFRVQDAVLLVGTMSVMIFLIVFVREITLVLMVLFLVAYSLLLFTFGYLLSKKRWYVGILPPAVFVLLYAFARDTQVWTSYLVNVYGLIFAVLITLYLVGLFTWKTTAVFGVLITIMDIILVLVTGTMIQAANAARSLNLPVLVSLPLFPLVVTGGGLLMLSLGLGDFFFAGLLGVQTSKRYGKRFAILSIFGMTLSFFIFEVFLLNYWRTAFPGTLMIICGWAPFVLWKELTKRKPSVSEKAASNQENKTENPEVPR
jgi:hypothetical protein